MATLMVTHEVTDVPAWTSAFEAGSELRVRHGALSSRVLMDGNYVVGLIEFADDESTAAFLADPELKRPIPGVPAPPVVRLLHQLDR
jgi:hypothetical protein